MPNAPDVAINLPPYRELDQIPVSERGVLINDELQRTAKTLHAIGEPFSPDGRFRWVAIWRAWIDGWAAVFNDNPQWETSGAAVYKTLDEVLDYAEGRDVPPQIEKLFDGSGDGISMVVQIASEGHMGNDITPPAPGIIEANLTSPHDVTLVVEHVLLDLIERGTIRTAEETASRRDTLSRSFLENRYRDEVAKKAKEIREFMNRA